MRQSRDGAGRASHIRGCHRPARAGVAGPVAEDFRCDSVPVTGVAVVLVGLFRQRRAIGADRPRRRAADWRYCHCICSTRQGAASCCQSASASPIISTRWWIGIIPGRRRHCWLARRCAGLEGMLHSRSSSVRSLARSPMSSAAHRATGRGRDLPRSRSAQRGSRVARGGFPQDIAGFAASASPRRCRRRGRGRPGGREHGFGVHAGFFPAA